MMDASEREKLIQTIAEQVLQQLQKPQTALTAESASPAAVTRRLITEQDVKSLVVPGQTELVIGESTLITPSAKDALRALRITVRRGQPTLSKVTAQNLTVGLMTADASKSTQQEITRILQSAGCTVKSVAGRPGSYSEREKAVCDLAQQVVTGELHSAIVLDEKVFCLNIAANRIDNVRGAICWDVSSTRLARTGCGANLLFVNDRLIGENTVLEMVKNWIRDQ